MTRKILLIEDEPSLVLTLEDRLRADGYTVRSATDGETGFELALAGDQALIVLDLNLPGKSGLDICRDLRARGIATPILMLTARGELIDRVVGLKMGADDYLSKPFEALELLARIEALLRRSPVIDGVESTVHSFDDVRVDLDAADVTKAGEPVDLSALELRLLAYFLTHRGRVLSRDTLLDEVWGYDATPVTRTVDVHVASLRQKLEDVPSRPRHLLTVHGRGYKFV